MKAYQDSIKPEHPAQVYQTIRKDIFIVPELYRIGFQERHHAPDAKLAHQRNPIRLPEVHRSLHPVPGSIGSHIVNNFSKVSNFDTDTGKLSNFGKVISVPKNYNALTCFSQAAFNSRAFASAGLSSMALSKDGTASLNSFLALAISAL